MSVGVLLLCILFDHRFPISDDRTHSRCTDELTLEFLTDRSVQGVFNFMKIASLDTFGDVDLAVGR